MSRIVYVNGDFVPEADAKISVFDRGFLMADAIYEVTAVIDRRLCDFPGHVARLHRSLSELKMRLPVSDEALLQIHRDMVEHNDLDQGMIYLQVTRGAADRDFAWPENAEPGMVLFTQAKDLQNAKTAQTGITVASVPDLRWGRRDIKTTQLLYASLAKMEAKARGADDAWMIEDGFVTEGSSNNAYIVTQAGAIVTRQVSNSILHGITRAAVLELAREAQLSVEERPFTIEEAQGAREAFMTAASSFVCPVVEIDGVRLGDGKPGPVATRLRDIYIAQAKAHSV
jgi:D-alanine transaminase